MITRIKELRARYGLTQEQLAVRVGVRRETIVFLEKGRYNPSLKLAHDFLQRQGLVGSAEAFPFRRVSD